MGLKADRLRFPSVAAVARSRMMRLWVLRATTTVLLWTCLVQLTAVGETWGPRVLRGWPSCRMAPSRFAMPAVPVVEKQEAALPPKSECCCVLPTLLRHCRSFPGDCNFAMSYDFRIFFPSSNHPVFMLCGHKIQL